MTTQTTPARFDPVAFKSTTREQWQAAAEAWHRWGAFDRRAGSARPPRPCSTWRGIGAGQPGARRGGRRRRAVAARRRAGSARPARCWPPTSRPPPRARGRRRRGRRAWTNVETLELDGEAARHARRRRRSTPSISRVGLIYFPDQQRALRGHAPRAARRAGGCRAVVYSTPEAQRVLLGPGRRSSAAAPSCRRRCPASPGRSRSAAPGVLADALADGRASATSRCAPSPRRCGCRRPPSACASSGSRSARCTR